MTSPFTTKFSVPLSSTQHALITSQTLNADKPKHQGCSRSFTTIDNVLHVHIEAPDLRLLRISTNSVMEDTILCLQTLEAFS
ncbi:hypothetical protein P9112_013716 [Eukaryota sp. TZLM1-RC]